MTAMDPSTGRNDAGNALLRRMNQAVAKRGLWQFVVDPAPPRHPKARERLLRKLCVLDQRGLPDVYLSPHECAELAGCSDSTIHHYVKKGFITTHRHVLPPARGDKCGHRGRTWISYRQFGRFLWGRGFVPGGANQDSAGFEGEEAES